MNDPLPDPLQSGLSNLLDYLSQHVLSCLIPGHIYLTVVK